MTAFEKHALVNERSAKTALVSLAATVIGKYVVSQSYMNSVLAGGSSPDEKSQECLMCRLDKITRTMSKFEGQVGQIAKSYEMMFGEEMDLKFITKEAVKEFYPAFSSTPIEFIPEDVVSRVYSETTGSSDDSSSSESKPSSWKGTSESTISYPPSTPDEVKDIAKLIKSTLAKANMHNVDIKVVDVSKNKGKFFGVNPQDYEDAESFEKAVIDAEASWKTKFGSSSTNKSGEEWIKDATIHAVEDTISHSETPSSKSTDSSSKGKLN